MCRTFLVKTPHLTQDWIQNSQHTPIIPIATAFLSFALGFQKRHRRVRVSCHPVAATAPSLSSFLVSVAFSLFAVSPVVPPVARSFAHRKLVSMISNCSKCVFPGPYLGQLAKHQQWPHFASTTKKRTKETKTKKKNSQAGN